MGGVKRIAILGSTGSIGRQALDVIRALPDELKVTALTGNKNIELLERQGLPASGHGRFQDNAGRGGVHVSARLRPAYGRNRRART